ncbi:MAG: DNA primase [Patescibacteria group bacterium]|nr:DNA primase [Patescibacteria group bacterium]
MASNTVEQIKQRLSIVDVVESYIKLERAGANLKGKCPFHNEKTPSFFVSPERGSYYCFGCGAKGDIFEFVQNFEGLDFMGALKMLAGRAGVEIIHENPQVKTEKERLYNIMEEACKFFESLLNIYPDAKKYLQNRGLVDKTIKEFRIGFIPDEWRKLHTHLRSKGYSDNDIEKVGLTKKTEKGPPAQAGHYDRFRGRIMFPIMDSGGRVIAFSGRILVDDDKSAKYLNSPDTELFNKSNVLYGIDKAKSHIRKLNFSILVEGQMDLIMSHQAGYKNTVAVSGTALTDSLMTRENAVNNLGIINRLSHNMILAFDADNAGLNATERSAIIGLSLGMDIKIATVPSGKDPADFILANPTEWKDVIKNSKNIIDFNIDRIVKETADQLKITKGIKEKVLPLVAVLSSNMEQSHFVKTIHNKTGISEDAIWEDLKKIPKMIAPPAQAGGADNRPKNSIHRKLLGIIFWQEKMKEPTLDIKEIKNKIISLLGKDFFENIKILETEKNEMIFQAEITYSNQKNLTKEIEELLCNFELEHLKQLFGKKMFELASAEKKKDSEQALKILEECQELSSRIELLKKR